MDQGKNQTIKRPRKQRNCTVDGVPYSTELLRRKRNELLKLRLEAHELTTRLTELQSQRRKDFKNVKSTETSTPAIPWRSLATIGNEKRQRAEKTNRDLKVLFANHAKLCAPILKILKKFDTISDMNFVLQLEPKPERPLVDLNFSDVVLNEMSSRLDWLRLDTDTMLSVVDSSTVVSFRWQCFPQQRCIQSSSITPVGRTAHEIGNMLWNHATDTRKDTDKAFHFVHRKAPSPVDMNVVASLLEGLTCINGICTFRKYDEGDRIILIGTVKWFLPTGELLLQDYNWTVISPSLENPLSACVMRNFYKLEMSGILSGNIAEAQQLTFHALGGKMRSLHQWMQNYLLNTLDRA